MTNPLGLLVRNDPSAGAGGARWVTLLACGVVGGCAAEARLDESGRCISGQVCTKINASSLTMCPGLIVSAAHAVAAARALAGTAESQSAG